MSNSNIHPTAVIAPGAEIGPDCTIGAFCYLGENVRIGAGNIIHSHVVIDGHTTIGDECEITSFACIGKQTQDLKYKGDTTFVEIGSRNMIREYATVHAATGEGNTTRVGNDCLIQAYCHIAHECQVGDNVIMSSSAMLSGHVEIGDHAIIGGKAGVVQFVRIGKYSLIGGFSKLTQDVLPFTIADGMPAETRTVNKIGMKRNGKSREAIAAVEDAFATIFRSNMTLDQATEELRREDSDIEEIACILTFLGGCSRGLARPRPKA